MVPVNLGPQPVRAFHVLLQQVLDGADDGGVVGGGARAVGFQQVRQSARHRLQVGIRHLRLW